MAIVVPPNPLPRDVNVGPILLGLTLTLLGFVFITTFLRIYARLSLRTAGWDDYTMMAAVAVVIVRVSIQIIQVVEYGNGRHRWFISAEDYVNNNRLGWFAQITLFVGNCLVKISIIFLMLRIKESRSLKIVLGIMMIGLIITNLGVVVILLAECRPISTFWEGPAVTGGKCWNTKIRIYYIYFTIAYSLATDFFCSSLPIIVVWKVQLPLKKKVSLWALMSLGLLATGFGVGRAASLGLGTSDLSYDFAIAAIWSNAELFLAIIGANLAISRSIYRFLRHGKNISHSTNVTGNPSS
ncbi:uncharacterized protein BCR38DRAFT_305977, partial [Pseudomassariella vexata]